MARLRVARSAGRPGSGRFPLPAAGRNGPLRGLTKSAALELAGAGIRVCSVHPGAVRTAMTADLDVAAMTAAQPLPRVGEPEEVARMVAFVVAEATYSTGVEFVLDGGATAGVVLTPPVG